MDEETITLTKREAERLRILHRVLDRTIRQVDAGEILGITDRQVRTLLRRVEAEGAKGLIHRGRGKPSPRKMAEELEDRIAAIIRTRYPDFSPLHAAEKLFERHRIEVSHEKVRQVMMGHGLWKRRRVRKEAHVWREQKHHVGEMVQMDGSHHAWLEERGPRLVLMGYVDDATGRFYGRFYDHEGVLPAMESLRGYIGLYGLPLAIYLDKHSTYKTTRQADMDELLRGVLAETQFERALGELGIQIIHAHSPQAKGQEPRRGQRLPRALPGHLQPTVHEGGLGAGRPSPASAEVSQPGRRVVHQGGADDQRRLPGEVAEPDVSAREGLLDAPEAEGDGSRPVRRPVVAPVQGPGPGLSGGPGASAGPTQAGLGQAQT